MTRQVLKWSGDLQGKLDSCFLFEHHERPLSKKSAQFSACGQLPELTIKFLFPHIADQAIRTLLALMILVDRGRSSQMTLNV